MWLSIINKIRFLAEGFPFFLKYCNHVKNSSFATQYVNRYKPLLDDHVPAEVSGAVDGNLIRVVQSNCTCLLHPHEVTAPTRFRLFRGIIFRDTGTGESRSLLIHVASGFHTAVEHDIFITNRLTLSSVQGGVE